MFTCKRNFSVVNFKLFQSTNLPNLNWIEEKWKINERGLRTFIPNKILAEGLEKQTMSNGNSKKNDKVHFKAECPCVHGTDRGGASCGSSGVSTRSDRRNGREKESIGNKVYTDELPSAGNKNIARETIYNIQSSSRISTRLSSNFVSPHMYNTALFHDSYFTQGVNITNLSRSSQVYLRSFSDTSAVHKKLSPTCFNSSPHDGGRAEKVNSKWNRATSTVRNSNVRLWKPTPLGKILEKFKDSGKIPGTVFKIMSYNVLAQDLLDDHPELYKNHDQKALTWKHRWRILLQEIQNHDCDILCLQEVQHDHINNYYSMLELLGYSSIYKQRTGIRTDGCAIYYKKDVFQLIDQIDVEYKQPNIHLLDRDNVAIVAKFAPKHNLSVEFVVATTHLLYNPRRLDVRLAQTQVLMTEIDRIAFKEQAKGSKPYLPVIITGDLNSTPDTDLYQYVRTGYLKYEGRELRKNHGPNGKVFLPPSLHITDASQHACLLKPRQDGTKISRSEELKLIRLRNGQTKEQTSEEKGDFNGKLFATGTLTHPFNLTSVYSHVVNNNMEGTTYQNEWITVDYIFYSGVLDEKCKFRDHKLKLLSRYTLPTNQELANVRIPNFELGSDHLALLAKFKLEY